MSSAESLVKAFIKNPPMVLAGRITVMVILEWEAEAESYFERRNVAPADQVVKVLTRNCFSRNMELQTWVDFHIPEWETRIASEEGVSFKEFMTNMRDRFFGHDWEEDILRDVVWAKQTAEESFSNYFERVTGGNRKLRGTPAFCSGAELRKIVCMNWSTSVNDAMQSLSITERERIKAIRHLYHWFRDVEKAEKSAIKEQEILQRQMENAFNELAYNFYGPPLPIGTVVPVGFPGSSDTISHGYEIYRAPTIGTVVPVSFSQQPGDTIHHATGPSLHPRNRSRTSSYDRRSMGQSSKYRAPHSDGI